MKIAVIGTRGFPGIQGGVETHCEELYTRLAAKGHDITVMRREPYVNDGNRVATWKGVKLVDLPAPRSKHFEAIVHTFRALMRARRLHPDIVHIHNIGPALVAPLARMMGMKVVVTVHSFNYTHSKWGFLAKNILRLGEWTGMSTAASVIAISDTNYRSLTKRYPKLNCNLIYNGVSVPPPTPEKNLLGKWGIGRRPYIVAIGRLTPEKGFHDLIKAYADEVLADICDLVIAGNADNEDAYSRRLREQAAEAGVILTGFIKGEPMRQLMSNASLFAITSYNEGLPLSLLEAMAYGLDVVSSDIEPCRLPMLEDSDYYPCGDTAVLGKKLREKISSPTRRTYDLTPFDWDNIAEQTDGIYKSLAR